MCILVLRSRSRFFGWTRPRAWPAFFKAAPAASCRQAKEESLVLVLSMNSEQLIKTNMITTRFALIINFQPAENDKILEHEAGADFFRLKPT